MKTETTRSWKVTPSRFAEKTVNPIRKIVENMRLDPNPDKMLIHLSIGDPTIFGNLKPCEEIISALEDSLKSYKHNGYAPSVGYEEAREAVAKYASSPKAPLRSQDVILTSGCSHALDLCITALANPGQNILVPRPGFPLYATLSNTFDIETKYYNLLPEQDWEVDLDDLESQIDQKTVAILINNPSNPCGSVYSKSHLKDILDVAARHCLPIIADEIYERFVFPGERFYPLASLTTEVPVLSCGGLTKRFLVPGWRMGWILIHDRNDILGKPVRNALVSLSQRIIGSNTVVQGALPAILEKVPQSFFDSTVRQVQGNATLAFESLSRVKGLKPIMPRGAMYLMVKIEVDLFDGIKDDMQFVEKLVSEQSVFCLPGKCFDYPNYFRVVLTVPQSKMEEACLRIREFCEAHCFKKERALDIIPMDIPRSNTFVSSKAC